jgi:hypothetical protein
MPYCAVNPNALKIPSLQAIDPLRIIKPMSFANGSPTDVKSMCQFTQHEISSRHLFGYCAMQPVDQSSINSLIRSRAESYVPFEH